MAYRSLGEDLALHGVRVLGFPSGIQFHEDLLATLGIPRGPDA